MITLEKEKLTAEIVEALLSTESVATVAALS